MDWHLLIGIAAGVLQVSAIVPYVRDILKRQTKPNIVSWALWTLIQLIAIWVLVTSEAGFSWSLILLLATTFNTGLVVVLCLMGYGYKEFGHVEKACLTIALVAIALYVFTKDAALSLAFDIVADLVAATPTIVKTFREPHTEAVMPWVMVSVAAALGALSSTIIDVENLALPIYLAFVNGLIAAIAFFGQRAKPQSAQA
ncbi:hypothetical protein EPO34_02780 [Patescibacteria group bacterium]|nr:MAG: hypothetical protein EPO34_02780 [Patescibacteria group bacterium]